MPYTEITEILKGKGLPHTLALIITVAIASIWITAKVANEAQRIDRTLDKRFQSIDTQIRTLSEDVAKKVVVMQAQMDTSWTIHMQGLYDTMIASHNSNHWTPDSFRIYEAIKGGRTPDAVRIGP